MPVRFVWLTFFIHRTIDDDTLLINNGFPMTKIIKIFSVVFVLSACGDKTSDTAQNSDTADDTGTVEPIPEPVEEPSIPDCFVEVGTTLYGYTGRLDVAGDGVSKEYISEERTIAVYEVLSEEDIFFVEGNYIGFGIVEGIEPLFTQQSLDGCYSFMLEPGEYSVVASFGEGWFCGESEGVCELKLDNEARRDFIWDNTVDY